MPDSYFASGLNALKKLIVFNDFESVSMFLIASNCFFPWSSIALNCPSFLPSIFFNLFKSPSFWAPGRAGRVLWNRVCLSFSPSFRLSGQFLGIVSLIFSKFWHGARIPCEVVHDSAGFLGKFFLPQKLGKWAKSRVFSIYWKIWSLILAEFDL